MAVGLVFGGVILGSLGALVSLATGGTMLAALFAYIVFGQIGVVMLMSGAALRGPFSSSEF